MFKFMFAHELQLCSLDEGNEGLQSIIELVLNYNIKHKGKK